MYDNDSGGGDGNHMTEMLEWVKRMIFLGIFLTLLLQVLPANAYRKYVRFFAGMVFVVTILNPLFSVLGQKNVEQRMEREFVREDILQSRRLDFSNMERQQKTYYERQVKEVVEQMVTELGNSCGVPVQKVEVTLTQDTGAVAQVTVWTAVSGKTIQQEMRGRSLWNRRAAGGGVWQLMDWNGFLREKKWKHVKKDQWLILFLAGVLLLIIAMPAGRKNSTASDVEMSTQNSQSAVTAQGVSDYETYGAALEQRLETILQRMRGVGDVQVMITFRDQGESIVEKDVTMREDTQEGEQKEGETDTVNGGSGSCENSETTVYARSDGDETPFVNRAILPKIDGVLIVAEGGDDSEVRKNISESVEALFGLDAHKIKIVKMKTKGDSN